LAVRQVKDEVEFPEKVSWKLDGAKLTVKGPNGELARAFVHPVVKLTAEGGKL
jgi:ribosomal protein L6P/L9E